MRRNLTSARHLTVCTLKHLNNMRVIILLFFSCVWYSGFSQSDSVELPDYNPLKPDRARRINPSARTTSDSVLVLFNGRFYRLNELNEFDKTIDGVKIESLDVVTDKDSIYQILSRKIKAIIIINDKKQKPQ